MAHPRAVGQRQFDGEIPLTDPKGGLDGGSKGDVAARVLDPTPTVQWCGGERAAMIQTEANPQAIRGLQRFDVDRVQRACMGAGIQFGREALDAEFGQGCPLPPTHDRLHMTTSRSGRRWPVVLEVFDAGSWFK